MEHRFAAVDERLAVLEARTAALAPTGIANVDFHFLQATAQRQLADARETREALRRVFL